MKNKEKLESILNKPHSVAETFMAKINADESQRLANEAKIGCGIVAAVLASGAFNIESLPVAILTGLTAGGFAVASYMGYEAEQDLKANRKKIEASIIESHRSYQFYRS